MKFKILHIIPSLSKGGAERLVLDICAELMGREDILVKLIVLSYNNEYLHLSQSIDLEVVQSRVGLSVFKKNFLFIESLQAIIEKFNPEIIHTHLYEAEIVSRFCYFPHAKWFSHCHDNMVQFRNFNIATVLKKRLLTNYFEKAILFKKYKLNNGTHFLAISKDTLAYFKFKVTPYKVTLLPNAINFSIFYKPKIKLIDRSKIKLINVGSFVQKKNQSFLIDVVNLLINMHIDVELKLIGNGVMQEILLKKVNDYNLCKNVFFLGVVNNVEEHLWQSDFYVHSSTSEASGLVIIEAMAAGLPVITLDGKGNRDLIVNEKNGYMFFNQSVIDFQDKIIELWNNASKYWEISQFAQEYAKKHDIKPYVNKLLDLYKNSHS